MSDDLGRAGRGRHPVAVSPIDFLQAWYRRQCDGDWEHQHGIEIGPLDNPGWRLAVDLEGTELEGRIWQRHVVERSEDDWWQAWCDGSTFHAAAGPANLTEAVEGFRAFVESEAGAR